MEQTFQMINRVLPILFLILLGYWIRRKSFLAPQTIEDLRKIAVNLALPAVLFVSFLGIQLQTVYLVTFAVIFLLCVSLFFAGKFLQRRLGIRYAYFPYLTTGFEYGMLGVSLFAGAYGLSKISYIAVIDLGHEIFIWFVFLPLLLIKREGAQSVQKVAKSFLSSPVVVAILVSLALNALGLKEEMYNWPVTGAMMATFEFLGNLTVPLILIIVGYGIKINRRGLGEALQVAALRLVVLVPLALVLNRYLIRGVLGLEPLFEAALFTLLVLPPPFIVPLYARADLDSAEKEYINNVLMVHTVISIALYVGYFLLNSPR